MAHAPDCSDDREDEEQRAEHVPVARIVGRVDRWAIVVRVVRHFERVTCKVLCAYVQ